MAAEPPSAVLPAGAVSAVLEEAQRCGFIGPGPVAVHCSHALAFVARLGASGPVLDLGTGGGLPGLVIAAARPDLEVVLLDARQSRVDFLGRAVRRLGWTDRVRAVHGRAEDLARRPAWRGSCAAVVARGFGPPALTAECAVGFLAVGGWLLVSEPPDGGGVRWSPTGLAMLGLEADPRDNSTEPVRRFLQGRPCPARFPRRSLRPPVW